MYFFVVVSGRNFYVYASLIPYACILMDYGRLLSQTFFSHFYNSITNPTRKSTLTLNTARCFFTKLAGGELLKQSACVLMFPLRMLFCRRSLQCNWVRDYLLSVFFHQKKGSKFAFKVAHSWLGDEARPGEEEDASLNTEKTRVAFHLFVLIVQSVWSNQLDSSH